MHVHNQFCWPGRSSQRRGSSRAQMGTFSPALASPHDGPTFTLRGSGCLPAVGRNAVCCS